MKPLIGVSCSQHHNPDEIFLRKEYLTAIGENGGLPVVIPVNYNQYILEETLKRCDGLFLTGGGDIDPIFYGKFEKNNGRDWDWLRDCYEIKLADYAFKVKMPILAICRGMQILNIYLNGTLYQDLRVELPQAIAHELDNPKADCFHPVKLLKNSRLHRLLGEEEIFVNSSHHQAVKNLGDSLIASAASPDGLVEALEVVADHWVIGVQWHPERLKGVRGMPLLFREFIKVAGA